MSVSSDTKQRRPVDRQPAAEDAVAPKPAAKHGGRPEGVEERGGPRGPEPTRYGDWEKDGRCSDF